MPPKQKIPIQALSMAEVTVVIGAKAEALVNLGDVAGGPVTISSTVPVIASQRGTLSFRCLRLLPGTSRCRIRQVAHRDVDASPFESLETDAAVSLVREFKMRRS
jgi:hypothetical protein